MFSMDRSISTGKAAEYYRAEFASSSERYYSEDGKVAGVWMGRYAAELGLAGAITGEEFIALAEGKHPRTGALLVRHREGVAEHVNTKGKKVKPAEHRAAFESQFAPPKSFSVQAAFDPRLIDIHNAAVEFAVREALEPYVQARTGPREAETTGRGVFATFQHSSSRPRDGFASPQLHTHVLVMNVSESKDGKTHALQPVEVYRAQALAGAVYDNYVAREVVRAGYELERSAAGPWEIRGYSREFIEAVSPEGEAIKREMKKRSLAGFEAKRIVALDIREKKDESLTPELMRAGTAERAREHGIDPLALAAQAEQRQAHVSQTAEQAWKAAHASLTYARDDVFEREAVNGERKLIAGALKRSMGETGFQEVRRALDSRLRSGEFVAVEDRGIERSLTTQRMVELESSNLAR
jgi:conjugative relaxase-like TrwC/TraI family protein